MYRGVGGEVKKSLFFLNMKKKVQSALLSPLGWWIGNNFLFKGGLKPPVCAPFFVIFVIHSIFE